MTDASATLPFLATSDDITELPVNIVHGSDAQLTAFIVLNFVPAHFGLPLLLAIILFSGKVHRHPTFINLCLVFILTGVSSCLLLYTGNTKGPEPPKMLCLFQASLLYGVPPMCSMAAFILVLQMWSMIKASYEGRDWARDETCWKLWTMIIAPYIGFAITAIVTGAFGSHHPDLVSRNRRFFYCSVKSDPITNTLTVTAAIFLFLTLVFGAWTVFILCKRVIALRRAGQVDLRPVINLPIRVLAFGVYIILAMSLSLLSVTSPASPVPDIAIASAPTCVLVIFGTQMDILRALCFWRKDRYPVPDPAFHMMNDTSSLYSVQKV